MERFFSWVLPWIVWAVAGIVGVWLFFCFIFGGRFIAEENEIVIICLLFGLLCIYVSFGSWKKMLLKKQYENTCEELALRISKKYSGHLTAPIFSAESSLNLTECERILKILSQNGAFSIVPDEEQVYKLDPLILEAIAEENGSKEG
ncbi:hypothetical protein P4S95_20945 [Aneurinibacillus aneurinilyticus]|uniref:hypothetical protein n=1 Tax=Aneurinibacillus aneurinilyticus TaxID=1391 RepID=UPI002E1CBF12|nr:hypothetical protein [Aneurinibacillus aneurinilyticus]